MTAPDYVSPRLAAGAASTRRPEDVLGARPNNLPCPFCGSKPTQEKIATRWYVLCSADEPVCVVRPEACSPNLQEAWAIWNSRAPVATAQAAA